MDQLKFAVIHSLEKELGPNLAETILRKTVLDVSNVIVKLLAEKLTRLVGIDSGALQWGQFSDNRREGHFPKSVKTLLADHSEKHFLAMAKTAMDELKDKIKAVNFATGGFLCFLVYKSGADDFLLVAMIKERAALRLNAEFEPQEITEIDLSKLHQAARINLTRYNDELKRSASGESAKKEEEVTERTYLCFAKHGTEGDVSNYFIQALGCVEGVSSRRATKALLRGLKTFFIANESIKDYADKARVSVVDYLMARPSGSTVKLDDIIVVARRSVPEELDKHFDVMKVFLSADDQQVPHEIRVDHKSLKPFSSIRSSGEGWKFSFESYLLGESGSSIIYDRNQKRLIFTELSDKTVVEIESELRGRVAPDSSTDPDKI